MSKRISLVIFIFLVIIFQTSFLPPFFSESPVPHLILITILFWASRRDFYQVLPWIIVAGFVNDILTFSPIGESILLFSLVGWGVNFIASTFLTRQRTWRFGMILILVSGGVLANEMFQSLIENIIFLVKAKNFQTFQFQLGFDFGKTILNNLIAVALLYRPLRKIEKFFPFSVQGIK